MHKNCINVVYSLNEIQQIHTGGGSIKYKEKTVQLNKERRKQSETKKNYGILLKIAIAFTSATKIFCKNEKKIRY